MTKVAIEDESLISHINIIVNKGMERLFTMLEDATFFKPWNEAPRMIEIEIDSIENGNKTTE